MFVRDLMTPDPLTLHVGDSIDLAEKFMGFAHIRHLPVTDDEGRVVGLITHRDLLATLSSGKARGATTARQIMRLQVATVGPETEVKEAIDRMLGAKYGCLPVVEHQRLVGIITEADFLKLARSLLSIDPARNI